MRFKDIQSFIEDGGYQINVPLDMLEKIVTDWIDSEHYQLQVNPDFQRGHVWTEQQQCEFVEFFLRGGKTGRIIYFNKPDWQREVQPGAYNDFVVVDGLQRLTALRKFMQGKLKVFGLFLYQFEGTIRQSSACDNLCFNINSLKTKREVLEWYLQMNTGGVVHSAAEIEKVKNLLSKEK